MQRLRTSSYRVSGVTYHPVTARLVGERNVPSIVQNHNFDDVVLGAGTRVRGESLVAS